MSPSNEVRSGRQAVSVCLPARNEEATVGQIVGAIRRDLMPDIVDEVIVIDSRSTDATAEVAAEAGAVVLHVDSIGPLVPGGGKGEALWKSLAVARGDIVVWIDADIRNFDPGFVTKLVEPLRDEPELVMTKAYYRRPLAAADGTYAEGDGGRVTELGLRPLLNLMRPDLAEIVQPLSGEFALRSKVARGLSFFSGYGVDIGLLTDVVDGFGLSALRQVDLGTRVHDNRSVAALGRTSFDVMRAFLMRAAQHGVLTIHSRLGSSLSQFDAYHHPVETQTQQVELPSWEVLELEEAWAASGDPDEEAVV